MKVLFFFPVFFAIILTSSGVSGGSNPSKKNKNNPSFYKPDVVIDGNCKEWAPSMFLYNKDAAISFAIANDSSSLYYCIKIPDEKQQMKVLRNGMDIWIDPAGKKNKKTGIHFPLGTPQSPGGQNNYSNGAQQKLYYMLQLKQLELTGFREGVDGYQGTMTNSSGVKAIIKWDSLNVMVYEAKIPFSALKDDIRESDQVSLGFIVNGMHQGQMHHPELNEEGHGGGMGGQGEGGHHMGGGGGYGHKEGMSQQPGREDADFQKMSEDNIFWHTIGIAKNK